MDNRKLSGKVGLVFISAVVFLLMAQGTIRAADDCKIVRIISNVTYQDVSLDPKNLVVDKGTCVIWFNKAAKSQVDIAFEKGKMVCEEFVEA